MVFRDPGGPGAKVQRVGTRYKMGPRCKGPPDLDERGHLPDKVPGLEPANDGAWSRDADARQPLLPIGTLASDSKQCIAIG